MIKRLSKPCIILKGVCKMRIISFGDLYADYYFKENKLVGICGGKSNANILANLSKFYETAFIGCVGNDSIGDVAINSLEVLGIDCSNVRKIKEHTKIFFTDEKEYRQDCPCCNRRLSYRGLKCTEEEVLKNIQTEDIIIVDNLNKVTLNVLKKVENKAFIDIGYLGPLMYASFQELKELLGSRFEIINLNERVYNVLKKKFEIDSMDLYDALKPKVLIITRGKRGADILFNGDFLKKEVDTPAVEVDSSGAGDAFFSVFIHEYLSREEMDEKVISLAYMKAESLARQVVRHIGARTHLEPLYKIENYKGCICEEITIQE